MFRTETVTPLKPEVSVNTSLAFRPVSKYILDSSLPTLRCRSATKSYLCPTVAPLSAAFHAWSESPCPSEASPLVSSHFTVCLRTEQCDSKQTTGSRCHSVVQCLPSSVDGPGFKPQRSKKLNKNHMFYKYKNYGNDN